MQHSDYKNWRGFGPVSDQVFPDRPEAKPTRKIWSPVSQARKSREAVEGLRVLLHEGFFAASEIFHKFIGRNWFHAPAPYRCRSK